jgi:hypothetical protein
LIHHHTHHVRSLKGSVLFPTMTIFVHLSNSTNKKRKRARNTTSRKRECKNLYHAIIPYNNNKLFQVAIQHACWRVTSLCLTIS